MKHYKIPQIGSCNYQTLYESQKFKILGKHIYKDDELYAEILSSINTTFTIRLISKNKYINGQITTIVFYA